VVYACKPLAPMVLATLINKGGTFLIPDTIAIEMEKTEPMAITKIMESSPIPNQKMAKGSQHMLGRVCSPNNMGLNVSSR